MNVDFNRLEQVLQTAEVVYLSTSRDDRVSVRPVSPLNLGLRLFIRTSASSRKAEDMTANPNIAVCVEHYSITGKAKALGSAFDCGNAELRAAYIARYPDSFGGEDEFIQSDEQFFELVIEHVAEWVYEDGVPVGLAELDC